MVNNTPSNAGDTGDVGSIAGSRRFPGRRNGSPNQYYCMENHMDRGAWQATVRLVTENQTWLSMNPCKTRIQLPYDPGNLLLDIYPEKALIWKDTCTSMFSTICNSQDMEETKISTDRWRNKEDITYIYMEYSVQFRGILLSHKKEWNNAICSNMHGPRVYHTKWSKPNRQILCDITYMGTLKIDTNLFIEQKQTHRLGKQTIVTKGKGGEG